MSDAKLEAHAPPGVRLGDLISAAYQEALNLGAEPRRAAQLAADAVTRILLENGQKELVDELAEA